MTHIKVISHDILDLIDEGLFSLNESTEYDSVWREGEDDIDRTVRAQVRKELFSFLRRLRRFILFSGGGEVCLSLEDFDRIMRAKNFSGRGKEEPTPQSDDAV